MDNNNNMEYRINLEKQNKRDDQVTELILDNCRASQICGLTEEFVNLETLSLINVGLVTLKGFPKLSKLKKLELSDNRLTGGLNLLHGSPKLQHLNISGNRIKDLEALEPLKEFKELVTLDLYNCDVTKVDDYRKKVFELIPNLNSLDGYDKYEKEVADSEESDSDVSDVENRITKDNNDIEDEDLDDEDDESSDYDEEDYNGLDAGGLDEEPEDEEEYNGVETGDLEDEGDEDDYNGLEASGFEEDGDDDDDFDDEEDDDDNEEMDEEDDEVQEVELVQKSEKVQGDEQVQIDEPILVDGNIQHDEDLVQNDVHNQADKLVDNAEEVLVKKDDIQSDLHSNDVGDFQPEENLIQDGNHQKADNVHQEERIVQEEGNPLEIVQEEKGDYKIAIISDMKRGTKRKHEDEIVEEEEASNPE